MRQKWKRAGGTEKGTKENDRMSFLHCIQAAVTELLDLGKQSHQLKQLHLHHGCALVFICTCSCSFYICCLRIIVPKIFLCAWQTLAVSTMTDLGSRRRESPYKQLNFCSHVKDWTDHQSSQTTSA